MKRKFLTILCLLGILNSFALVGCGGESDNTGDSSSASQEESSEEAKPDMSEDEAKDYAKSAVESEIYSIPESEMPQSDVPGVAFNKFGTIMYDTSEAEYDESKNAYIINLSGSVKANYAVNGAGLVANDVKVNFDASVKVMVSTGDTSFVKGFDYTIDTISFN